jgi:hypothetical protein
MVNIWTYSHQTFNLTNQKILSNKYSILIGQFWSMSMYLNVFWPWDWDYKQLGKNQCQVDVCVLNVLYVFYFLYLVEKQLKFI